MKKKLLIGILASVAFVGCGPNYQGTYTGTDQATGNGLSIPSAAATLSITQSSAENISIAYSGAATGNLVGRILNGSSATITGGTLTSAANYSSGVVAPGIMPGYPAGYPTYPTGYPTGYNGYGYGTQTQCNVSGGTISKNGRTLTLQVNMTAPTTGMVVGTINTCPTSRSGTFNQTQ